MSSLNNKDIPQRNIDLVMGYCKQIQKSSHHQTYPQQLQMLCLYFLNQSQDEIIDNTKSKTKDIIKDLETNTIKAKDSVQANISFANIAKRGVHIWEFKAILIGPADLIGIQMLYNKIPIFYGYNMYLNFIIYNK